MQQSKKLAEILPLESADMWYEDRGLIIPRLGTIPKEHTDTEVSCWSLAALLNVLPRVDVEKEIFSNDTYNYRVKAYIGDGYIGDWFDNPVDACYEMILKLHELKML